MADSEIEITPGSGAKVDTRVVDTDQHRQVMVIGDPSNVANVATVNPSGELLIAAENPVPVDISTNVAVSGEVAHGALDVGYPIKIGGRASSSAPTAVSNGQRADAWFGQRGNQFVTLTMEDGSFPLPTVTANNDGSGASVEGLAVVGRGYVFNGTAWDRSRAIGGLPAADANTGIQAVATVPHKTGYALASITARYTTTQTSTIIGPTVGAAQKMVVTSIQIQTSGTTAGDVVVYFGTGAYTRGTNRAVFDGHFIPSATNAPGYTAQPNVPYEGPANGSLRVTTSAAVNPLTITAWYYLVAV